jgi:large repetitive protein
MRHICDAAGLWLAGARRRRGAQNLPPVTAADAATVFSGTPTIIDVLANDSDPEGGPLTIPAATAAQGTVAIRPDRTLLYTSPVGFTGTDTVTYAARDALGRRLKGRWR